MTDSEPKQVLRPFFVHVTLVFVISGLIAADKLLRVYRRIRGVSNPL